MCYGPEFVAKAVQEWIAAVGAKTAYIERPLEFGRAQPKDVSPNPENNLHARDINQLADLLGC